MKQCKTCQIIAEAKEIAEITKKCDRKNGKQGFVEVVKMKMVQEVYKKGQGRLRGSITHGSRKMNFCPECGRKLKSEEIKWEW